MAIVWAAATAVSQGRIVVARHSPPIISFAQGYSVIATRAPSMLVSPKRTPAPTSAPQACRPWGPRIHPVEVSVAADRPGRRGIVLDGDGQGPQRGPGPRFEAAGLCLGAGAEQPVFERPLGRREAGDEVARRDVGRAGPGKGSEAAVAGVRAEPLLEAVVESVPPASADPDDAGAGRRRPAPAGEPGPGDGLLPVAREALQMGAVERVGAGRRRADRSPVGTSPRRSCRPRRRRSRGASRTGRPRTCPPSPRSRRAAAGSGRARPPARRSGRAHLASPTLLLLLSTALEG